MTENLRPEFPIKAIVQMKTVYQGNNPGQAMKSFEYHVIEAAEKGNETFRLQFKGGKDVAFSGHGTPGNRDRPVIEAHALYPQKSQFIGALYGVTWEQWIARPGKRG